MTRVYRGPNSDEPDQGRRGLLKLALVTGTGAGIAYLVGHEVGQESMEDGVIELDEPKVEYRLRADHLRFERKEVNDGEVTWGGGPEVDPLLAIFTFTEKTDGTYKVSLTDGKGNPIPDVQAKILYSKLPPVRGLEVGGVPLITTKKGD